MEQNCDYENIQYNDPRLPIAYACGRCIRAGDTNIPWIPKWHEQLEFKLILAGKAEVSCGSNLFLAREGDIIAVNACELHSMTPVGEEALRYHLIMLSPLQLYGEMHGPLLLPYLEGKLRFRNHICGDTGCRSLFLSLMEEMETRREAYPVAAVGYFSLFLTELIRCHTEPGTRISSPDALTQYAEKLEPALAMISEWYREDLTLAMLADACGISLYHFSRIFTKVTGQSAIAYLNAYRMGKAEMLIRSTLLPINDISASVGYTDNSYFSRSFRKRYGCTPSEYRRKTSDD